MDFAALRKAEFTDMAGEYEPSAAATLIERSRVAHGISVRQAAKGAGLSEGRWRQIAKGYQQAARGFRVPVNAPDATLARMALAVDLDESALRDAGEVAVAEELRLLRAPVHGRGVVFDFDKYSHAYELMKAWIESEDVHPPRDALWLWTPLQLAGHLAEQVAVLELAHEQEMRERFHLLAQGKVLPTDEEDDDGNAAANMPAGVSPAIDPPHTSPPGASGRALAEAPLEPGSPAAPPGSGSTPDGIGYGDADPHKRPTKGRRRTRGRHGGTSGEGA